MRIKKEHAGVDDPRKALKYAHARHLHSLEDVRCSDAGDEGHSPWYTDPWGGEVACSLCREYALEHPQT